MTQTVATRIAEWLRSWRSSVGMKQVEVAVALGVCTRTYQRWEAGTLDMGEFYLDQAHALADGAWKKGLGKAPPALRDLAFDRFLDAVDRHECH